MSEPGSWVKINRNIMDWRWYTNANVKALFLHLILKAYIKDGVYKDQEVHRGQVPTTLMMLAAELGVSVQTIRTGLKNLKESGEITSCAYRNFTLITVENYELYQEPLTSRSTARSYAKQQTYNIKRKKEGKEGTRTSPAEGKYVPQEWELTIPKDLWGRFDTEDAYWQYAAQGGEK